MTDRIHDEDDDVIGHWGDADGTDVWAPAVSQRELSRILSWTMVLFLPLVFGVYVTWESIASQYLVGTIRSGGLLCGAVAIAVGSLWARRLWFARVSDVEFVVGTTTLRLVVAALILLLAVAAPLSVAAGLGALRGPGSAADEAVAAIAAFVGPSALIGMAGPGYSEYRKAMRTVDDRGRFPRRDWALVKRAARAKRYTVKTDVLRSGETRPHLAWQQLLVFSRGKLDRHYGLVRNGKTLVAAAHGQVLEIHDPGETRGLVEIARTAAMEDVQAALLVAEAAGITAAISVPTDEKTRAFLRRL